MTAITTAPSPEKTETAPVYNQRRFKIQLCGCFRLELQAVHCKLQKSLAAMKNVLIIGHSNIGDVCYNLAVVKPLQRHFPEAKIHFLTSSRCREIVDGYNGIHSAIIYDRSGKDKGFFRQIRFVLGLRERGFDLVVVLKKSARQVFLGAKNVWRIEAGKLCQEHPVDRYLKLLRDNGINADKAIFDFTASKQEADFCRQFFQDNNISPNDKLACIMPLAAWSLKSWPVEKWNELAGVLIHQRGFKVIAVSRLPDNSLGRKVLASLSKDIIMADKTTLRQAMAIIERSNVFIGPDSSLLHIASCMETKTIGLYGPTPASCFYPYFHRSNIVMPRKKFNCMPCCPGMRVTCNKGEHWHDFGPCMQDIRVEDVLAKI
jgi:heptosyltransferase II